MYSSSVQSIGFATHYTWVKKPLVKTLRREVLPVRGERGSTDVRDTLTASAVTADDYLSLYLEGTK